MKITIASEGKDVNSRVSLTSGRAPYFLIFEDGNLIEVISNPFRFGGGGAGVSVAQMLANKGVELFIGTKVGENMKNWLISKGIKILEVGDITVKEALEKV